MHAEEIVDRLTEGLDRMDQTGPSPDLAQEATRRLRRRRRTRRVTATGGVLSALLVAVLAISTLAGEDPEEVILEGSAASTTPTSQATPTPETTPTPPSPSAPTAPPPVTTPGLDIAPPTATSSPSDGGRQPAGSAPDLLLSNGDAIGIRTASGDLVETFIVVPEEEIERRLGAVAVRPGTDRTSPTFAYVDANETGETVVLSDVGPDGRTDRAFDARVDTINGRYWLSADPVWSPSGDGLAWLSHDADGRPAISTATEDDRGVLTEIASSPLPLPEGDPQAQGDRTFRLVGYEAADADDRNSTGRLLVQVAPAGGLSEETVLYRVGITEDGAIIDVAGADVDRVGPDPVTGRPVVDRTGTGEDAWVLSGTPVCQDARCPDQPDAGYVLRRGDTTIELPEDVDQGVDASVPILVAAGADVIVLAFDPQTYEPVAFRVRPDGAADGLGYDAISISPLPTG